MNEQQRRAALATMKIWKREAREAAIAGVGYGPDPDLPECPWHGEWLDEEGGCCLCDEQTGDPFAYWEARFEAGGPEEAEG